MGDRAPRRRRKIVGRPRIEGEAAPFSPIEAPDFQEMAAAGCKRQVGETGPAATSTDSVEAPAHSVGLQAVPQAKRKTQQGAGTDAGKKFSRTDPDGDPTPAFAGSSMEGAGDGEGGSGASAAKPAPSTPAPARRALAAMSAVKTEMRARGGASAMLQTRVKSANKCARHAIQTKQARVEKRPPQQSQPFASEFDRNWSARTATKTFTDVMRNDKLAGWLGSCFFETGPARSLSGTVFREDVRQWIFGSQDKTSAPKTTTLDPQQPPPPPTATRDRPRFLPEAGTPLRPRVPSRQRCD